jgi:hypothetical protein
MNEPHAVEARRAFSLACTVAIAIQAPLATVWSILTDAASYPRWNSTITGIEGRIQDGERLRLHVPGTSRTFTPRVSGFLPNQQMVWTGGFFPVFLGVRTFTLRQRDAASTDFTMAERFSGLMLAVVKGSLPDFRPVFEAFARDLKREAERVAS